MKVAFNATSLLSPLTGVGHYSRQIAIGLAALRPQIDPEYFYGAIWSQEIRDEPAALTSHLLPWVRSHVPFSYAIRRLIQTSRFTARVRSTQIDIYHEPNLLLLPFDGPTVLTVHDLSWIRHPEAHPIERVRAMDTYFEPSLRRATHVLTDSDFVRQELIDVFGLSADRIQSIPLGVEALFRPMSVKATHQTLASHSLTHGQYLLAVGTLEPRKNLSLALHAYMAIPAPLRQRFPLVLVGMKGWHASALERQIAPLVQAGEVRQLGYLPREELATIVAGAAALIYPSIYEGFGLPPLEAMACGVPVIASNVSSIPEVVGASGMLIHPQEMEGWRQAIEQMLSAPDIRDMLGARALKRSRQFSWSRCVAETVGSYRLALSKS